MLKKINVKLEDQKYNVFNGDFAEILNIKNTVEENISFKNGKDIKLKFQEIEVKTDKEHLTLYHCVNYFYNEDSESDIFYAISILLNKILKEEFLSSSKIDKETKHKYLCNNITNDVKEGFADTRRDLLGSCTSMYFKIKNTSLLRYAWVLTTHYSSSYQFDNIILDMYNNQDSYTNEGYFRWLYTALATSRNKIYIINHKKITPFLKIQISDDCIQKKSKEIFFYSNQTMLNEKLNSLKAFLKEKFEAENITLQDYSSHQFLQKYEISHEDKKAIIAISYNSSGEFKKPTIIKTTDREKFIKMLIKVTQNIAIDNFDFIYDKWRAETYKKLSDKLAEDDIIIYKIIQNSYQDTIFLFCESAKCEICINFNQEGFFTHLKPIFYSDINLWNRFKMILEQEYDC